jgi:hypothetical protein
MIRESSDLAKIEYGNVIFKNYAKNLFKIQYAAYPTPPTIASIIQGLHNWVSLNFQIKMPAAAIPNMALIIFRNIIKILYSKIQPFFQFFSDFKKWQFFEATVTLSPVFGFLPG